MKTPLLVLLAVAAVALGACYNPGAENKARYISSYYAQQGEKMNPTIKKVDQRNPKPNATPTPPTKALPASAPVRSSL